MAGTPQKETVMTDALTTFTVDSKAFADAVSWVGKGVSRNANIPEYETIHLKLEGSTLSLTGYNGASLYTHVLDAGRNIGDEDDYNAVVNGPMLTQVSKVLKSGLVTIEAGKKNLLVRGGRSQFTVPLMNLRVAQLPKVPDTLGTVLSGDLRTAINQVSVAASSDETLASLTAVLFEFHPAARKIRLVACDRFQLAIKDIAYDPAPGALEAPGEEGAAALRVVIPARALKVLIAGLTDNDVFTVHGATKGAYFGISSPKTSGYVNTFDDDFVKYERLLSVAMPHRLTVDTEALKSAVSTIVSVGKPGQNVLVTVNADGIVVSNMAKDSSVEVDAIVPEGVEEEFGFSSSYLNGALRSADADTVSMAFQGPRKPAVFHGVDGSGEDAPQWMHLVMPTRG